MERLLVLVWDQGQGELSHLCQKARSSLKTSVVMLKGVIFNTRHS